MYATLVEAVLEVARPNTACGVRKLLRRLDCDVCAICVEQGLHYSGPRQAKHCCRQVTS